MGEVPKAVAKLFAQMPKKETINFIDVEITGDQQGEAEGIWVYWPGRHQILVLILFVKGLVELRKRRQCRGE